MSHTSSQSPFHTVPAGEDLPQIVNAIIEIPKGERVKYEYDKDSGVVKVDRVLKTPINYPCNYGLIPQTWNDYDNDPADIIVLGNYQLVPGCLVECRIVGIMGMDDGGERDDKIIAVPAEDPDQEHIQDIGDVSERMLENLKYFMEHYKDLQGKKVTVSGYDSKEAACKFVEECVECYQKKFQ